MRAMKKKKRLLSSLLTFVGVPLFFSYDVITLRAFKSFTLPELVKKILVIEMFGIGDFVMASSTFRALRDFYPSSEIVLLTVPTCKDIAADCPYFDHIIYFECPWPSQSVYKYDLGKIVKVIKLIREYHFAMAIDLRGDLRNILFMCLLGVKYRVGYDVGGGGFLLTHKVPYEGRLKHQVDHNSNIAKFLGARIKSCKPELWVKESNNSLDILKNIESAKNDVLVAIHPGANWYGRRWRLSRFAEIVDRLCKDGINSIIISSAKEESLIEEIKSNLGYSPHIVITKTLKELALLLKRCHLLICNDSGPMHIAVAVNTPVIALFGPQDPTFHGPYGSGHRFIRHVVKCSPCTQDICVMPENSCMDLITVDEVYDSIKEQIKLIGSKEKQ